MANPLNTSEESKEKPDEKVFTGSSRLAGNDFFERLEWNLKPGKVKLHYPQGVRVSSLIGEIAEWTGVNFVMDPSLDREVHIIAPCLMAVDESFELFLTGLQAVGLRALYSGPKIVKIVVSSSKVIRV